MVVGLVCLPRVDERDGCEKDGLARKVWGG